MSYFIYVVRPARSGMVVEGPTQEEGAVLDAHFGYLQSVGTRQRSMVFGRVDRLDPSTFGVVIFSAESIEEARDIMEHDPAVQHGLMTATLDPFRAWFFNEGEAQQ